ncbi:MAG TPA: amidohydrolase family protein [Patescibacteria group bacterium]|nr:amidohydrolase family protein [Patescibacteria group bacterium]
MPTPQGREPFETVLRAGRIHAEPDSPIAADTIGIRGETIVALGSWADLAAGVGPATRVLDAGGRIVTPAFIDSHTHFHRAAVARHCFLDFETLAPATIGDVLEHVRVRATAPATRGAWIQGDSLSPSRLAEGRLPDRHDLDRVAPDAPVVLRGIGKHVVAANSAALAAAGIDRGTADPAGGRIERDGQGEPTGILHETAKLRLDQSRPDSVVPTPAAAERHAALRAAYSDLHAVGIATIHEIVRLPDEAADHAALRAAGDLGVRVRLFYRVHESPLSLDWLIGLGIRRGLGDDWLKVLGVKVSIDGFCIFRNAAVEEPYRNEPTNRGLLRVDGATLDDLVARANRQGLQVALHAVGPRAVDLALDAFERAGPPLGGPYRLEHAYLDIGPDRLRRARASGAAWSVQPAFLDAYRREWADAFEPDRIERIMPLASGAACGLEIQFNSDVPCAPFDPLDAIRLAVTRRRDGTGPAHPEGIGVAAAWRAFTTTPAGIAGEPRLGRLAVGSLADLIVVDGDPFGARPDLAGVAVRATMVGGRLVHDSAALGG